MTRRSRTGWSAALAAAVLGTGGCVDPVLDDRTVAVKATGSVLGVAYVDLDGNGAANPGEASSGVEVWLMVAGGGYAGGTTTDTAGVYLLDSVPVGTYQLRARPTTLPSGSRVAAEDSLRFVLAAGERVRLSMRLTYPTVTLAEARALPPGRRVFTHGIALNTRSPFGDGVVHLQSGPVYVRATDVARAGFGIGDSLRFLGTTALDAGQPILTDVRPFVLVAQAALVRPLDVSAREAATARGATLDAALVRVRSALVTDTTTVGEDLLLGVNDGTGRLEVLLRDFLSFSRAAFVPNGVRLDGVGLLVPVVPDGGAVRWRLTPRSPADLVVRAR